MIVPRFFVLLFFTAALTFARAEDAVVNSAPEETNAPLSTAETTNTPPPELVAFALTAGTGAMILSGVEWSDDDEPATQPAGAPAQIQPADGEAISGDTIAFSWNTVDGAATYLIDVDQCGSPDVCADFRFEQTASTSLTIEWLPEFAAGRWRVRMVDAENIAGPWSAFRYFTVTTPAE